MASWKKVTLLVLSSISTSAFAQDFPVMDWGPMIQTEAMNSVTEDIGRSEAKRAGIPYPRDRKVNRRPRAVRDTLSQSLATQLTGSSAATAAIDASYKPSAIVREKLAGILSDAVARQDAAKREEMRQLVLSARALQEYERIGPSLGLRANDAIDAYAFYLLAQWGVANDHRADVTRAQAVGVRRQAAGAYATIKDQLGTDALRQEFAEALVIQGTILAGVHETAVRSGDEAALARYAALARRGGTTIFSMDPSRIALTDAGFRTK